MVKMVAIPYAVLFLLVLYYNNKGSGHGHIEKTTVVPSILGAATTVASDTSLARRICGAWNITGELSAIFVINKKYLIYPETEAYYPYSLRQDSMTIHYSDHEETVAVSLRGEDTLVLTHFRPQVYSRFKGTGFN